MYSHGIEAEASVSGAICIARSDGVMENKMNRMRELWLKQAEKETSSQSVPHSQDGMRLIS